ncbi:RFC4 [Enterospora canceri]|uniref:RFC4 n=1 Tax=Enterospora canceri TaxID=1081671 RepID=A0A1Y1S5P1_9MICR|nr:RFC4 [Enterospora canceri]
MALLLTEKYRPAKLEDVIGNEPVVKILRNLRDDHPHILLCGPPGTGKTTIAKILSKKYEGVLELNASDERGIDVVRNRIKGFTQVACDSKLVILDECDNLTTAAQQALRRIIETKSTKFILICNEVSKMIEAIQSRMAILKFDRIGIAKFDSLLDQICQNENIHLTQSGKEALVELSRGDFRSCLNILQGVLGVSSDAFRIDDNFLYSINGVPNRKKLLRIVDIITRKETNELIANAEELFSHKYDYSEIMNGLFSIAKDSDNYEFLRIIGAYQHRMSQGNSSRIQFYAMFGEMLEINK